MVPRIFISSTYYDLKHVRERLEKFINNYGFEPILFESDKVTYQPDKKIDQSAYYEVSLCHFMVLIIGGRYGSPSSPQNVEEERKKYDEQFISITRKEYDTATQSGIPIMVFIDKNVYSEYQTYKENQEFFDSMYSIDSKKTTNTRKFKFAHVDHLNVFKFIEVVKGRPIKTFEKVEEIETYLKAQLSGMFYLYLESLKKRTEDNKILNTISELNSVTLRMNEMLSSVGKQILGKDNKEYEQVIENQLHIMIDFYAEQFREAISFEYSIDYDDYLKIDMAKVTEVIYEIGLKAKFKPDPKVGSFSKVIKMKQEEEKDILEKVNLELSKINLKLKIIKADFRKLGNNLENKVKPFIKSKKEEGELLSRLKKVIDAMLDPLPF